MPNPNKSSNSISNVNSHGKPRINLDERIAKKRARANSANDKFRNNFRDSNKQIAISSGEAIEDRLLYEASKDLEEQLLEQEYDAVVRANNRYAAMVNNTVAMLEADEDEQARRLQEVDDDVIDVDFEEIKLALPERKSRFVNNRFLNGNSETNLLTGSDPTVNKMRYSASKTSSNKYQVKLPE